MTLVKLWVYLLVIEDEWSLVYEVGSTVQAGRDLCGSFSQHAKGSANTKMKRYRQDL